MCGIVGAINGGKVASDLLTGLRRLEYRGYDSAGLAVLQNDDFHLHKAQGELKNLEKLMKTDPIDGRVGISHTRWATHGEPSELNAHPHTVKNICVVHNGIIENYQDLRDKLISEGHEFLSQTDTEVIPHLIVKYQHQGMSVEVAIQRAIQDLEGAYAICVMDKYAPDMLFAARHGSPLVLGYGEDTHYVASDAMALAPITQKVSYLEDDDFVALNQHHVEIYNGNGTHVQRAISVSNIKEDDVGTNGYEHFMQKEIFEQPDIIQNLFFKYFNRRTLGFRREQININFSDLKKMTIVACGTSYYAAQTAKYWFEKYAHLPVEVDIASEFRYRESPMAKDGVALFISQSGETADTIAAMKYAKSWNQKTIGIVNSERSTIARECDLDLMIEAGPEIGVASTKAFTAQLMTLACMAMKAGIDRGALLSDDAIKMAQQLSELPEKMREVLDDKEIYDDLAELIKDHSTAIFVGRGLGFPLAMEGALKLKEISYIHAEGFGAGELKHGPIALIEQGTPVIAITPDDALLEKNISNIREVQARGANVIPVGDCSSIKDIGVSPKQAVKMPSSTGITMPILYALPMQLLAYATTCAKGLNVDKPRNLAKSVTVE
ncbi:MAG: glutamine--fructose-6-phosphate transaminase (isomerizing) [Alphaproteobacteria bacterium]|nr:glutamine--fructose-6-phosphate transaminase (isomerizing) [Alphaproteobacteria bacterium]